MSESIYKQRLLKLADHLENNIEPERFNFSSWVGKDWKGLPDLSCGTTACAFGFATTIPEFQQLGLCLFRNQFGDGWVGLRQDIDNKSIPLGNMTERAANEIFGLDSKEFVLLFIPHDDLDDDDLDDQEDNFNMTSPRRSSTAKEVAQHIKNFVDFKYGK